MREMTMSVGVFRSFVLDVNDLARSEHFWTSVLGLELQFSGWMGQFSRIGKVGAVSVLLQLVPENKTDLKNRAHLDVAVDDVGTAVDQVLQLGGGLVKEPALSPNEDPVLEWAVMSDPSGNEFCLIREVRPTL
jgi:predicted enzyme related to lactoylglutathione lyase